MRDSFYDADKDLKDVHAVMVDNGLFEELAVRLAREFGSMSYYNPWEAEFPVINDRILGAGLPKLHRLEDPYLNRVVDATDLYIFPDIFHAGKQELLERVGKRVWGSREGDELETKRVWFRGWQQEHGMPVPDSTVLEGFSALVGYLQEHNEHCFIKTTSKIRGTFETHEFWDMEQAYYWLEEVKRRLGCAREMVLFLVEKPIDSKFETGIDTYDIDGQVPKTPLQGIEIKGQLILCSAQTTSTTPKPLDEALTILEPELRSRRYRNFLSAEFREKVLTDICTRCPNPGIGCEMEMIENLPEIIYKGAAGELVEPKFVAEFGIQAAVYHTHDKELGKQFRIDPEVRQFFKLMEFCEVDGLYQILPRPPHGDKIGWLVGIGDTIEEAADHLKKNAEYFKKYPFEIKLGELEEAVRQAHAAEEAGFEFTDQTLPDPEEVAEEKT